MKRKFTSMTRVFALFDHIFDLNAISPELVYKTYYLLGPSGLGGFLLLLSNDLLFSYTNFCKMMSLTRYHESSVDFSFRTWLSACSIVFVSQIDLVFLGRLFCFSLILSSASYLGLTNFEEIFWGNFLLGAESDIKVKS